MAKEYLILYSLQQQFPSYKASSAATFTGWRRHYEKTILPVKAKGVWMPPRITKRQDSRFMAYIHVRHPRAKARVIALSCAIVDVQSTPAG